MIVVGLIVSAYHNDFGSHMWNIGFDLPDNMLNIVSGVWVLLIQLIKIMSLFVLQILVQFEHLHVGDYQHSVRHQ